MREPDPILVTGATGYVGSQARRASCVSAAIQTRTLSRRGTDTGDDRRGDVLSGDGLPEALDGVKTAYYLVHSMGTGGDFAAKDRQARSTSPRRRRAPTSSASSTSAGSARTDSEHLRAATRSRELLRARLPGSSTSAPR